MPNNPTAPSLNEYFNSQLHTITINTGPPQWPYNNLGQEAYGENPLSYTPKKYKPKPPKTTNYNSSVAEIFGFSISAPPNSIGLELECEGLNLFDAPISYWTAHQDQSLRAKNGSPPIEYVLRKPCSFDECKKALKYLGNKLEQTDSQLDNSTRTSVHVHVNCQQDTMQDVLKFICLYLVYEDLLTKWCGPFRVGNLFCLRVKDAEYFIQSLILAIEKNDYRIACDENYRYMGCNIASLRKFGTIEFRTLRGTVDEKTILTWVDILLKLKERALQFENPRTIVELFNKLGPLEFFKETFPKEINFFERHTEDIVHSMWEGLRLMRDIAYCEKWKPKPLPEEEKKVVEKNLLNNEDQIIAHNFSNQDQIFEIPGFGYLNLMGDQTCFVNSDGVFYAAFSDGTITWRSDQ